MKNILRFNVFVVSIYIKNWFLCQLAQKAPANDLQLLKDLERYKSIDDIVATAVQNKFRNHLWYLSEANIALALFDDEVEINIKRRMIRNFNKEGHPENPKRINLPVNEIMSAELCDFVSNNTYLFFETILNQDITGVNKSFLKDDPVTWSESEDYVAASKIVKSLLVVNDIAERGIALITRFNAILTHQEDQKQLLMQTMEEHFEALPSESFSKSMFVNYLNKTKLN